LAVLMPLEAAGWHWGFQLVPVATTFLFILVTWMVVSLPVYLAAKIVTAGRATFLEALVGSLAGPVLYYVTLRGVDIFLGVLRFPLSGLVAFLSAFLAFLWVYKSVFSTGWLGAFVIAVAATAITVAVALLLAAITLVI
jgi:hypothetical protein